MSEENNSAPIGNSANVAREAAGMSEMQAAAENGPARPVNQAAAAGETQREEALCETIAAVEAAAREVSAAKTALFNEAAVTVEPTAQFAAATVAVPAAPEPKLEAVSAAPSPGSDEWQAKWNAEWNSVMSGAPSGTAPGSDAARADAAAPVPNAPAIVPAKKRKMTDFAKKAVAVCIAAVLGCGFLGLGLSFGGQIANML